MAKLLRDDLSVCTDCLFYIANGDLPDDPKRAREVEHGVASQGGYVCPGESDGDEHFSWRPCHCCGSKLGGNRHPAIVLGD